MSTTTVTATGTPVPAAEKKVPGVTRAKQMLTSRLGSLVAVLIALLWTIPTFGLLVTSFRPRAEILGSGWWNAFADGIWTLDNYELVLFGSTASGNLFPNIVNSIVITIPGALFPLIVSILAAYAFSVLEWKGRDTVFIFVFALQIVPLQMALIPLLQIFSGTWWANLIPFAPVWIAHTCFALPLATFLMHNFMSEIPRSLIEAAKVDGAGHATLFVRVILPLMVPAIASFAIFQVLWVWNDLLVGLTFTGGSQATEPITSRLSNMASANFGNNQHLLTSGAFISMILPLIVFFTLQRYFVRGMMAGSVKG
ncbi:MAG TPA: carbohydrate ABC transporter permease [Actinomycetaceae bacterium]|nr:carbohydrate ABC transporter permease [Actinomycetaceae bacterium]